LVEISSNLTLGSALKPWKVAGDERPNLYQGASYQPLKDTWKLEDETEGVQWWRKFPQDPALQQVLNLASERPAPRLQ